MSAAPPATLIDREAVSAALDADGYALTGRLLGNEQTAQLRSCYEDSGGFRSVVDMQRHGYGRGQYKYFSYPLPRDVSRLRERLYAGLAPIANDWQQRLGDDERWPPTIDGLIDRCRAGGQRRPTPLLLRYGPGDYNCLHQDVYGDVRFPFQVIVLLSGPGRDFDGGELVIVEQRPRRQSRVSVLPLAEGEAAIVPVRELPRAGKRGWYRASVRHGVSRIRSGERFTLGIIFHDAT